QPPPGRCLPAGFCLATHPGSLLPASIIRTWTGLRGARRPVGPARLVALDHDALTAQRHGHIVGLHAVLDPGALLAFIFGDAVAAREGDADIARGFGQGRQVLGLTYSFGYVVAAWWTLS